MTDTRRSIPVRWVLAGGLAGVVLGSLGIASAQTDDTTTPTTTAPAASSARAAETPLTGDAADKAKAAALAAVPGATIDRIETDGDGATYEVHLTRPDGTRATVKLDDAFKVTATEDDQRMGHGPGGPGGRRSDETELTGDAADKARAAALAAVPGGTIDRLETDADGATYEAHMTKPDGTHVTVKLDDAFKVTATEQDMGHGPGGPGHHGGPDADADAATPSTTTA
jgi:uncharacterized membrane protein YkoI